MRHVPITAAVAALCCLAPLTALVPAAAAASRPAQPSYHGTRGSAARLAHAASVSGFRTVRGKLTARQLGRLMPQRSPAGPDPAAAGRARTGTAPRAAAESVTRMHQASVRITHAFNGISNLQVQSFFPADEPVTPPDQGLCVGRDATLPGDPKAVFEPINLAVRETTVTGAMLRPDVGGDTFWQDPFSDGDIRCLYDPSTRSFYFTAIGFPVATGPAPDFNNTTVDVVVMNARGVAAYQFDTSLGGPSKGDCLGDQPKTGFDNNALVISTDEFCDPAESDFEGAIALVISKPELVSEDATVSDTVLGPVSLAGNPVTGLDPAIGTGSGTEYLVNSVPFLPDGSNNPVGSTLGLWTLRNTRSVTTGIGSPVLTSKVLPSEAYGFPVPATSTGDGSTFTSGPFTVTSETALNPDDSRVSAPVSVTRAPDGSIRLWTALDAALTPSGDTAVRDGAAWFEINPARQRIAAQGYVAVRGAYLLYPALEERGGTAAMVFTITSATINPSAAFTTLGSRTVTTVAAGAGPHQSFSDSPPFSQARWGDYSFAVPDPGSDGIWLATEYIPPAADQAVLDNWGTYLIEVRGR
jgi:hypothetical protein